MTARGSIIIVLVAVVLGGPIFSPPTADAADPFSHLFGYKERAQEDLGELPQWLRVLERHLREDVPDGSCRDTVFNRCHLNHWLDFLDSIRRRPPAAQLTAVNNYANRKPYVLDIDNYAEDDYWAIAKEFLANGGDCEDYAITKFFSLRWLGYDDQRLRLVILQDSNLNIAHAVLAVSLKRDILILDNQTDRVVSHRSIVHYAPLYSVNEEQWWLHLPAMSTL